MRKSRVCLWPGRLCLELWSPQGAGGIQSIVTKYSLVSRHRIRPSFFLLWSVSILRHRFRPSFFLLWSVSILRHRRGTVSSDRTVGYDEMSSSFWFQAKIPSPSENWVETMCSKFRKLVDRFSNFIIFFRCVLNDNELFGLYQVQTSRLVDVGYYIRELGLRAEVSIQSLKTVQTLQMFLQCYKKK